MARTEMLVLQQRVPESHSATAQEHEWHDATSAGSAPVDVTAMSPAQAWAAADVMLKAGPKRNDYVYRIILRIEEIKELVIFGP